MIDKFATTFKKVNNEFKKYLKIYLMGEVLNLS